MKFKNLFSLIVVVLNLWFLDSVISEYAPVIETTKGPVRGLIQKTVKLDQQYYSYRNIRYAKPPVGYLRFKPPVEVDAWTEVLDAVEDGPVCPQVFNDTYVGEEDCLNLNVYTTKIPDQNDTELRPVMFWIYGGSFKTGFNSKILYSPDYLIEEGVVFVSVNYRLGPLGFLALKHPNATGNAGLKDQLLALEWVRDNIAKFGGDPNKVTIFGQSAGGASVDFHILSRKSKGLFHRAISQSGTALAVWAIDRPNVARNKAVKLAWRLGSKALTNDALLKFFYDVDARKLTEYGSNITSVDLPFKPTLESVGPVNQMFLTKCPIKILKSGEYNQVPHMLGYLKDETLAFLPSLISLFDNMDDPAGFLEDLGLDSGPILDSLQRYPNAITNITIFTDLFFVAPIDYKQQLISNSQYPVYYYRYTFDYDKSLHKIIYKVPVNGSAHSDELPMLFYSDYFEVDPKENSTREEVQSRMTRLWTNFAKYGNPTPNGAQDALLNVEWPDSRPNGKMLEIGAELKEIDRYTTTQIKIIEGAIKLRGLTNSGCVNSLPGILELL